MRNGHRYFRRRRLWRVLIGTLSGALGGVASISDVWAADTESKIVPTQSMGDPLPALRLSPQLGASRNARRSKPARDERRPPAGEAPLRLSLTILLKPEGARLATTGATGSAAAAPAERSADGDSDSEPVQPEKPVPFDSPPAAVGARRAIAVAAQSVGSPAKQTDSGLPDLSGETWVMAPIRWSGITGTYGNFFSSPDGQESWNIHNTLNLRANSFIGAPYIAEWSGLFGRDSDRAEFSGNAGAAGRVDSSGTSLGGSVNVFPVSNFPFTASFNHRTSEVKFGQNRAPVTDTSFSLHQQYRTGGGDAYSAAYTSHRYETGRISSHNSRLTSSALVRRVVDDPEHYLDGSHTLNAVVTFLPGDSDVGGQRRRELNANISHNWAVHEDLTLNNTLTLVDLQQDQFYGNDLSGYKSRLLLASTNFNWRPDEDLPLTLYGSGNFSQTSQSRANQTANQQALAANLSTNYRFSNNLYASGNTFLASLATDDGRYTLGGAGVSASYAADPLKFGEYLYNWNLGGGVNANFSSEGDNFLGANTSVGHSLTRTFVIDQAQTVSLNAGQTLSLNRTQGGADTLLSHNAGAAWVAAYGDALTGNLNANLSDVISTGQTNQGNHYASLNLVGGGQYRISSTSALSLTANINWSKTFDGAGVQGQPGLSGDVSLGDQGQWSGGFTLGYTNSRPFSIPNLNYNASLLWANSSTGSGPGTTSTSGIRSDRASLFSNQDQQIVSFQQSADYRIGRLTFRLQHAMIDQAGKKSASIFGSVNREFDGFFDGRW